MEPAGDRFRVAPDTPVIASIHTDREGLASCHFPPSTHVRPASDRYEVTGLVPDSAGEAELIAVQPDGTTTTDGLFETVLTPLRNAERPEPFVL